MNDIEESRARKRQGSSDRDVIFAGIVADLFDREAAHWEAEYEYLTTKYGVHNKPQKVRAAWKLGASMLRRRAEQYRSGTVGYARVETAASGQGGENHE